MNIVISLIVAFFCLQITYAQVGINTVSPKALLEVQASNPATPSVTDGVLLPKIDAFPTINPTADQDGMMVYVTGNGVVEQGFYFWNDSGSSWQKISGNKSELELITEGFSSGWRLRGMNPANYGNIGTNAIDLSISNTASTIHGATSTNSIAVGLNAQSSEYGAMAFGISSVSSGSHSIAVGPQSKAIGPYSTAIGFDSYASGFCSLAAGATAQSFGDYAMSYGRFTASRSYLETAMGSFNTNVLGNLSSFVPTDRHFVIGNGSNSSARSDALVVLKNGTITAPSFDIAEITDLKALVTKEYADATYATPENPVAASLVGNWAPYGNGYETPHYYKHNKRVYLSGLLRNTSTMTSGEVIFTLPIGYRPTARRLCAGGQTGMNIRIDILANGTVQYMGGTSGSLDFISLDGISFETH
ncbi:MAG: hypothetical protein CMC13_12900 [Flavobacteriaceae bacterium]|nr:hypothetical protein [Flavobacteriaceae bacterium]